nr:hypothetical protein [Tanacetum cinerariifolium]
IWEAFGGYARDLDSIWKETGQECNSTEFSSSMVYMSWRRRQDFHLMLSWFQGDDIINFCDRFNVADIEEALGRFGGLTASGLTCDAVGVAGLCIEPLFFRFWGENVWKSLVSFGADI